MDETTNSKIAWKPSTLLVVREVVRSTSKEIAHFIRDKPTVILSVFIIGIWAGAFSAGPCSSSPAVRAAKNWRDFIDHQSSPRPARQKNQTRRPTHHRRRRRRDVRFNSIDVYRVRGHHHPITRSTPESVRWGWIHAFVHASPDPPITTHQSRPTDRPR